MLNEREVDQYKPNLQTDTDSCNELFQTARTQNLTEPAQPETITDVEDIHNPHDKTNKPNMYLLSSQDSFSRMSEIRLPRGSTRVEIRYKRLLRENIWLW